MNSRIGRIRPILLFALAAISMIGGRANADTAAYGGTFTTTGQSIWDTGAAFSRDYTTSVGTGFNAHPSIGTGIGCGLFGDCYGAEAALHLVGNIGINLGAHVDSGTVAATMPFTATIDYPHSVQYGSTFTPSTTVGMGAGAFSTTAPNVGAFADLTGSIYAAGSARICFIDCAGTSGTIVNASFTTELAAFNRNGDGQLRVMGGEVPLSGSIGPTEWTFTPPVGATGAGTTVLTGSVSTDVVQAGLDVAGLVASALGVPISGSLGIIDWSLISASATLDTYLDQVFWLNPNVVMNLHVVETGQDVFCTVESGCGAISAAYGGHFLTIQPYFQMDATFRNETGLVFAPGYDISLLSAGISGIGSIGPAFQWANNYPLSPVNLYSNTFDLQGFNIVAGPSFTVAIETVPEPASLTLLGSGIVTLAMLRRKRSKGRKG
jgi:hypothetical protein